MRKYQHGPAVERFWGYVHKTADCWLWVGALTDGYGVLNTGTAKRRQNTRAHRLSWLIHRGPIPPRLLVLHRCDVRHCVNPNHLFLGTPAVNVADMDEKGRRGRGWLPRPGITNPTHKLTAGDIPLIREAAARGETFTALGLRFGISRQRIALIVQGRAWAHL